MKTSKIITNCIKNGGKIITCGNGGSLCDAQHMAAEFTGRFQSDRRPLPAICINDPAYITAVANDYGYEHVFSRYIEGVGRPNDVLIAFTTSGKSKNVIAALELASEMGIESIIVTGPMGYNNAQLLLIGADCNFQYMKSETTAEIQEETIKWIHQTLREVEELL